MAYDAEVLIKSLSIDEKASLCSGLDFWNTKPIPGKGVYSVRMADGPNGLRKHEDTTEKGELSESVRATCFPPACTSACSFDRDLVRRMGAAIGEECREQGVSVILGPGANIKRTPLCGRNFEYFSEDPYLTGEMASAMIDGIQSRGIGTSLKHFAANNRENARFVSDSVVDERALREIYLAGFEAAVKNSRPASVMCSYNLVNGTYASENEHLLTRILREEWGFAGLTVSDWGAVSDRVRGIAAGLDLEMPGLGGNGDREIASAVREGRLSEAVLDAAAVRILELAEKYGGEKPAADHVYETGDGLAGEIAVKSAVLLKNEGLLPANEGQRVAVIGGFARNPRYQGSGSARVNPASLSSPYDAFIASGANYSYAAGYSPDHLTDDLLLREAVETAGSCDIAFVFAGLPDEYESEGYDRSRMDLPESHNRLISAVAAANPNTAVILFGGSPITMPWIEKVKAVLMCYLPGQAGGRAVVDLLFGKAVPCGKLAESFPLSQADIPCVEACGTRRRSEYRESIYVGYRYYDAAGKTVLFPFGHGLSYTNFEYTNLSLSSVSISGDARLTVLVGVKNTGIYDASEIVQIYVEAPKTAVFRAPRELKGFDRIFLRAGESGTVSITLGMRAFSYYNVICSDWFADTGEYRLLAGASSRDIRLEANVRVAPTKDAPLVPDFRKMAPAYYDLASWPVFPREQFEALYGRPIPSDPPAKRGGFHRNSTLSEIQATLAGRMIRRTVMRFLEAEMKPGARPDEVRMRRAMADDLPLRALVTFSAGKFSGNFLESVLLLINGHVFRGLRGLWKERSRIASFLF